MNGIEKIITKLGPHIGDKGPIIAAFLLANPYLIPILLACGGGACAIMAILEKLGAFDQ